MTGSIKPGPALKWTKSWKLFGDVNSAAAEHLFAALSELLHSLYKKNDTTIGLINPFAGSAASH